MNQKQVLFKGTLGGLHIQVDPDIDLNGLKKALDIKFMEGKNFFDGTPVNLVFTGRNFNEEEKQDILNFVASQINLGAMEFSEPAQEEKVDKEYFDGIEEGITRFFRGTVRNGQRITYNGNIVIIGDVNPGGEVVAAGNIIVFGTLRGMAHAGSNGNHNAIVAAFCLQPTQLRIGSVITRPPEGDAGKPSYPEFACIKDNNLIIEPYLPGRGR